MTVKSGLKTKSIQLSQKEMLETPMRTILTLLENEYSNDTSPFKQLGSRDSALAPYKIDEADKNSELEDDQKPITANIVILPIESQENATPKQ